MSKLNAKWLNFDSQSMENSSGDLQLHIKTSEGLNKDASGVYVDDTVVMMLTGNQTVAGTKTFSTIPVLPASNPTADNEAVRKAYVDGLLTGLTWEDPVYHANQLVDGASGTGGIRPAAYLDIDSNGSAWSVSDTIVIAWNDGSAHSVTLTAVDNASPGNDQFDINTGSGRGGESSTSLATEIIRAVNDSTSATMGAIQGESARSVDTAYFVNDNAAVWTSLTVTVTGPTSGTDYKKADAVGPNLGKLYASLEGNETHFARGNDNGYTWSDDENKWVQISGVGSLPDATRTQHGVVEIHDGLTISSGELSVYLDASGSGLELSGTAGQRTLGIADDGVTDAMINWSTAGSTPNAGEVSAADVPLEDSAGNFATDNVEAALAENATDIATNTTNISGLADNTITGGNGIDVSAGGTLNDADTTLDLDIASNRGLTSTGGTGDQLDVVLNASGGLTVDASGLAIAADGVDDTMIDWGTGANQVSAGDMPIADAGGYFTTDTVEAALQQLGASSSDVSDNNILGGSGIEVPMGGQIGDSTTILKIDLEGTNPGLEFGNTDGLKVKVKTDGGVLVDSDGLYIDTSAVSIENKSVESFTLDATDISNEYVDLSNVPLTAANTQLAIVNGLQQLYSVDFAVVSDGSDNKRLTWDSSDANVSVGLDTVLAVGDKLIVWYTA